jgi:TolA-binding protein
MWKRTPLVFAVCTLALAGCQKHVKAVAAQPVVATLPPLELPPPPPPDIVPPPPAPRSPLEDADNTFNEGRYGDAGKLYETYLKNYPNGDKRDGALFHLALVFALSTNPPADFQRASILLRQIVDGYPRSPMRAPALVILSLYAQVNLLTADEKQRDQKLKQLQSELDKLKQIDAERQKHP